MAEPGAESGGRDLPGVRLRGPLAPSPRTFQCICSGGGGPRGPREARPRSPAGARPLAPRSPPPGCTLPRLGRRVAAPGMPAPEQMLLKMADSPPRQLQPPGLQRGLTSSPHPHPGDPTKVLADREGEREGREPALLSLAPVPHTRPLCALEETVTGGKESVTSSGRLRATCAEASGSEGGSARAGSAAAPYLDICCPAPAARTRSSACRGAATPHTRGSPARSR